MTPLNTIIITVEGGMVTCVQASDPTTVEVLLRDWDVAESQGLRVPEAVELGVEQLKDEGPPPYDAATGTGMYDRDC